MIETIIKAVISWPVVVLLLALMFRRHIVELIARLKRVEGKNFALEVGPPTQSDPKPLEASLGELIAPKPLSAEQAKRREEIMMKATPPLVVIEQEDLIRRDIDILNIPQTEVQDILIRQLAVFQFGYFAETVYRLIFGSQIELLKAVNQLGPRTKEQLTVFYETAKVKYPTIASYPFNNYLNFLLTHRLLLEADGKYSITTIGKEFLVYLVQISATENKLF